MVMLVVILTCTEAPQMLALSEVHLLECSHAPVPTHLRWPWRFQPISSFCCSVLSMLFFSCRASGSCEQAPIVCGFEVRWLSQRAAGSDCSSHVQILLVIRIACSISGLTLQPFDGQIWTVPQLVCHQQHARGLSGACMTAWQTAGPFESSTHSA